MTGKKSALCHFSSLGWMRGSETMPSNTLMFFTVFHEISVSKWLAIETVQTLKLVLFVMPPVASNITSIKIFWREKKNATVGKIVICFE